MEEKQDWAEKSSEAWLPSDLESHFVHIPGVPCAPLDVLSSPPLRSEEGAGLSPIAQMEKKKNKFWR